MAILYQYDVDANCVRTTASGRLDASDWVRYCQSVLADPRIQPGFLEAVTLLPDAAVHVTFRDLLPFSSLWKRYLEKGVQGTLILPQSESAYGVFRMFEGAISSETADPDISFELLPSAEAMELRLTEIRSRFPVGSG